MTNEVYQKPVIIRPKLSLLIYIQEFWRSKSLLYFYAWRDIKVKYKQTILGIFWAILQPVVLTLVFILFFTKALKISTDNIPPVIFFYTGILIWNLFSSGLSGSSNSIISNANIIKKIYFPRLVIPLSAVLVSLFDFLMAVVVFIFIGTYYHITGFEFPLILVILSFVPAVFITCLATIGLGCALSSLNALFRDFRYILPFLIQLLLFITPVIYPVSIFEHSMAEYILAVNPLTGAIELIRSTILSEPISWISLIISSCSAILLFILGLYIFMKIEPQLSDKV